MTIANSVLVQSPLYVAGNLCLTNTSAITAGPLVVQGSLTMSQSANYAGTSTTPSTSSRSERVQMEEQLAAQPLPAGGGSKRLRQRLCDDHHEQPRHVGELHG